MRAILVVGYCLLLDGSGHDTRTDTEHDWPCYYCLTKKELTLNSNELSFGALIAAMRSNR